MGSTQRLGWLSSSYSSTLVTKLEGAQGKAGRLVKDEIMQSGRCCVMTEGVVQSSQRGKLLKQDGSPGGISPSDSKLGLGDLSTGQEDAEAGTLEEYATLLPFELSGTRELLGGHNNVEAGDRKGRGIDDKSSGAQLPKSKASVRKEVDSEEHHSTAEVDLLGRAVDASQRIVGLWAWQHHGTTDVGLPWSHRPLALMEGVKGAEEVENAKANSKYQDRAEGQRPRNFLRPVLNDFLSK
ncbi:hypothetical protein B296_00005196 [Ensete ventricosum]|uniref:Uncharacterized protein n=1 Tax=Ensete ventricosum TaxID=4639 RepID=A0A427A586_ENSVE|nr:hypothetical protein B296_00005196 [Ensete ventricosum]